MTHDLYEIFFFIYIYFSQVVWVYYNVVLELQVSTLFPFGNIQFHYIMDKICSNHKSFVWNVSNRATCYNIGPKWDKLNSLQRENYKEKVDK